MADNQARFSAALSAFLARPDACKALALRHAAEANGVPARHLNAYILQLEASTDIEDVRPTHEEEILHRTGWRI